MTLLLTTLLNLIILKYAIHLFNHSRSLNIRINNAMGKQKIPKVVKQTNVH